MAAQPSTNNNNTMRRVASWGVFESISKRKTSVIELPTDFEIPAEPRSRSASMDIDTPDGSPRFTGYFAKFMNASKKFADEGRVMNIISPTSL